MPSIIIGIIVLNYNNFDDTKECIDSVLKYKDDSCEIVLVDNCSTDDSLAKLKMLYDINITIIELSENMGYAAGNNIGIRYLYEKNVAYICILNNDTVINSAFWNRCINILKTDQSISFVSPFVLDYYDGFVQSTGGFINLWTGNVNPQNLKKELVAIQDTVICDYVGGACLIFRKELIDLIGYIPECYFLFFEETEWCYKATRKNMFNVCIKCETILHKGSASVKNLEGLQRYLIERNRVVFEKRNSKCKFQFYFFLIFIFCKTLIKAVFKDKKFFEFFEYYMDGIKGKVDKRFPYIYINNQE